MAIKFSCACGCEITVKDEHAGKKGKCPACGQVVQVPRPDEPQEASAPGPVAGTAPASEPEPVAAMVVPDPGDTKACAHCRKQIPGRRRLLHQLRHGPAHRKEARRRRRRLGGVRPLQGHLRHDPQAARRRHQTRPGASLLGNFRKALILLGISLVVYCYVIAHTDDSHGVTPAIWVYALTAVMAVGGVVVMGVIANVAGTMSGGSAPGSPVRSWR